MIECMQQKTINVPATIVAYNMFTCSVEIMDQKRESTSVKRKEKHLSTYFFNYVNSLVFITDHDMYDQLLLQKLVN